MVLQIGCDLSHKMPIKHNVCGFKTTEYEAVNTYEYFSMAKADAPTEYVCFYFCQIHMIKGTTNGTEPLQCSKVFRQKLLFFLFITKTVNLSKFS